MPLALLATQICAAGTSGNSNPYISPFHSTDPCRPWNSWDRVPYWTFNGVNDGFNDPAGRSLIKARDLLTRNFLINGYNGVWGYDFDDGSQFYNATESVLLWGGLKNYEGNSKIGSDNLLIYPGADNRATGNRRCQTNDDQFAANGMYIGNRCVEGDGQAYSWAGCNVHAVANTTYQVISANTHYSPNSSFSVPCGGSSLTFAEWQALGQDAGSTLGDVPSVGQLVTMVTGAFGRSSPSTNDSSCCLLRPSRCMHGCHCRGPYDKCHP